MQDIFFRWRAYLLTMFPFLFRFQVPTHFLPVVESTLREFFAAVRDGKDSESSWKKQIYKIIARFDEPIPEYFKTQDFLKQLE